MKKLTLLVLLTTLLIQTSNAQSRKFEVNIYFMPDSLELPTNMNKINSISEISRSSKGIITRLSSMNPKAIKRAFPDFSPSDTLFTRTDGKRIKLMNLSRIFTLEFNSEEKALDAIEILQHAPGVLFAEPNWGITNSSYLSLIPDSEVQDQWHLNNTGQNGGSVDADIDGTNKKQLTNLENTNYLAGPEVSPDGEKIVFTNIDDESKTELFLLDYKSGEVIQITNGVGAANGATWRPSRDQIAFNRIFPDGRERLYLIDTNTYEVEPIFQIK